MTYALPTELKERSEELFKLREKQNGFFDAIKSAQTADEKAKLKEQAKAGLQEIEAKAASYEEDFSLYEQERANKEALKSMEAGIPRVPFSGKGSADSEGDKPVDGRSLGQRFIEHPAFKSCLPNVRETAFNMDFGDFSIKSLRNAGVGDNLKTTMTTAAGWAPYGPRIPGYVPSAQLTPTFADLIPQTDTNNAIFYYMEETAFTNNAAYVAEGATKPESAFELTSRTVQASKIATTLPVSEEQLEDVEGIRDYIDDRLTFQIQLAEESALLNFTSGSNGWDGFLQKSGVQTQARGTDPIPTAVLKAMVKVRHSPGYAGSATGIAMNPLDWQDVLTLQETTGAYIWSMPSAPTEMPEMKMWGMTVRPVEGMTENTSLLGNFRQFSRIWRRAGLTIRVAYANDDVLKNLVRLIAEERIALQISRAAAFCKITGV